MFEAYKAKKWEDVIGAGKRLHAAGKIDWEAELNLAQALRLGGHTPEAIEMFKSFLADFPGNKYAAEARATMDKLQKK
jgi:TolA-binding protein